MESLNGHLVAAPAAVSWGLNRIDVFAAGQGNTPWQWTWNGVVWTGPMPLPSGANIPATRLTAVSSAPNRLDVFAAGPGNTPWWWRWNGASWNQPKSLPQGASLPAEALAATSSAPDLLDVFGAGAGNTPWWWHWNGTNWSVPQMLPAGANLPAEGIAAISARPNRLDVFAAGAGNHLWHWAHDGAAPWTIEDLGGNLPSEGVSVVSSGPNRIDVFAASRGGVGNPLQHWWWDGARFVGPQSLPGNLTAAAVSAVTSGSNRMDVFGVAGDGALVRWQWDGSSWLGPNPRGFGLPAGDVAAVASAPGRIHVFARGADNTLQHWPGGGLSSCSRDPWTNFAQNHIVQTPVGHCKPTSLAELVGIVKQAEQLARHVRAVGSSWSFSDIAVTDGYIVETNLLNSVLTEVLEASPSILNPKAKGLKLIHVEAGMTLRDLNNLLDKRDLALRTMGGASGQTLAGAVSTCVHGADLDRGPLPDAVRAIHLVGPGGVQHWIEPSESITDKRGLTAALGLDPANVHYDDDWFNSVLVSMGSLGIIYSMVIEVTGQYDLVEDVSHFSWEALRPMLETGEVFTGQRAVLVAINPFTVPDNLGSSTHPCYLSTRNDAPKTQALPSGGGGMTDLWHWLGGLITFALEHNPNGIETTVTQATEAALPQGRKQGFGHTVMATSDPPLAPGLALEIGFDATNTAYLSFVDEALQILDTAYANNHWAFGGWFSMRWVGQSRAYLSPQHASTRTCMVEMAGLGALSSTKAILDLIEAAGQRHGGIQHWGMFSMLAETDVRKAYKDLDKWLAVRWQLTNNGALHTFDNGFSERCGLTKPPRRQRPERPLQPERPLRPR